jgi:RNA processing factor Prp31
VQKAVNDLDRFKKMVTFEAQYSFKTAEEALENMQAIAHNKCSPALKAFLKSNLASSSSSKKQKFSLGIMDPRLGPQIHEEAGITASFNDTIVELLRGIRAHYPKLLKKVNDKDMVRAQLGLSHSYSRHRCAQDVNR